MTALADALLAAQRQAIAALEKAYVAGHFEPDELRANLCLLGCNDLVEQDALVQCLEVLRTWGTPAPAATKSAPVKPMTEPQRARIERDCREKDLPLPDFDGLTSAQASEVISSIEAGTYDAAKWSIPL